MDLVSFRTARFGAGFLSAAIALGVALTPGGAHAEPAAGADAAPRRTSKLPGYEVIPLGRGNYNRLSLPITVDGKKGVGALDTGASGTVLNIAKFGFLLEGDNRKLPDGVPATAHVNDMSTPVALVHDFRLGAMKAGGFPLRLAGQRYFEDATMLYEKAGNYRYDGIIGEEVLRHFNAIIDCTRLILYLNTDPGKQTKLESAMPAAGWTRVPMSDAGVHLVVPCTLGGHKFNLLVDTGAPFTHLDRGLLQNARIQTKDIGMRSQLIGDRVAVRSDLVMSDSIQIGDFTALNVHMTASDRLNAAFAETQKKASGAPLLGLLGGDILGRNNAVIDIGGHGLYLKHPDRNGDKKP